MIAAIRINAALCMVMIPMITICNRAITLHTNHLMHPPLLFGRCRKTGHHTLQWNQSKQQRK